LQTFLEAQIGPLLRAKNLKLVLAESCTGGLVGHRITNIPGSSEYYLGSVTAYAYEAKERLLGVRHETLATCGAVSRETALEMARGVRQALAADFGAGRVIGVSITGIAGPGGGTPTKPVGLVWIALSTPTGEWAFQFIGSGSREQNKAYSADQVLRLILAYLKDEKMA
jgi:PncC family amidohydrolase